MLLSQGTDTNRLWRRLKTGKAFALSKPEPEPYRSYQSMVKVDATAREGIRLTV